MFEKCSKVFHKLWLFKDLFDYIIIFIYLFPLTSYAEVDCVAKPDSCIAPPTSVITFDQFINKVIYVAQIIGIPLVAVMIIYSGFLFATAGGKEKQLETAKKTFYWAIIGAAIIIGAGVISGAVQDFAQNL